MAKDVPEQRGRRAALPAFRGAGECDARRILAATGLDRRDLLALSAAALALLATLLAVNEPPFSPLRILPFFPPALAAAIMVVPAFRGLTNRDARLVRATALRPRPPSVEFACGVAGVVAGAVLVAGAVAGFIVAEESFQWAWLAWISGALLSTAGVCLMDRRASDLRRRAVRGFVLRVGPAALVQCALLALVIVLAASLRTVALDTIPPGMETDERSHLLNALTLGNGDGKVPPYIRGVTSPPAYMMMVHRTTEFVGVSVHSIRLVSAFLGVAGVVAVFLLGRRIMGTELGIIAAAVLASMAWHINFSRIGLENVATPACAALAAWAMLRALSSGRRSDFALAGAVGAAGYWFYEAYYPFPVVLGAMFLHVLLRSRPQVRRSLLAGAATMALLALAWLAPLLAYAADEPEKFLHRVSITSVHDQCSGLECLARMADNTAFSLRTFHFYGDIAAMHNAPGDPMLGHVAGALLLLGAVLAAARWRRAGMVILPVWMLAMMITSVLTDAADYNHARRSIGILPALALLIALPLALLLRSVTLGTALRQWTARAAVAAVVTLVMVSGVHQHFFVHARLPVFHQQFFAASTLSARDARQLLGDGFAIGVSSEGWVDNPVAQLLHVWPDPTVLRLPQDVPVDPAVIGDRKGLVVYLKDISVPAGDPLLRYYPHSAVRDALGPDGVFLYRRITIMREHLWDAASLQPDHYAPMLRSTAALSAHGPGAYTGSLRVRNYGRHHFQLRHGRGVSIRVGDRLLFSGDGSDTNASAVLALGLHDLEIRIDESAGPGAALYWHQPESKTLDPIGVGNLYHGAVRPYGMLGRYYLLKEGDDMRTTTAEALAGARHPDLAAVMPQANHHAWRRTLFKSRFVSVLDGVLDAPHDGEYTLRTRHCYGDLSIGVNGRTLRQVGHGGTTVRLTAGPTPLRLVFESEGVTSRCILQWRPPGSDGFTPLPQDWISVPGSTGH